METGLILGRYRPLAELGEGGHGAVDLAFDTKMARRVAIKRIPLSRTGVKLLARTTGLREARTAALLNHPNTVTVYEWDTDEDEAFLIMEHVDGASLADLLDAYAPLDADEAAAVLGPIADALLFAHDNGVLHLDLKPDNVLITRDGLVKVGDFGVASLTNAAGQAISAGGTLGYMPPEQLRGETVDARTDMWAYAALAFEVLTGAIPFASDTIEGALFKAERTGVPAPGEFEPALPPEIDEILMAALSAEPADRPDARRGPRQRPARLPRRPGRRSRRPARASWRSPSRNSSPTRRSRSRDWGCGTVSRTAAGSRHGSSSRSRAATWRGPAWCRSGSALGVAPRRGSRSSRSRPASARSAAGPRRGTRAPRGRRRSRRRPGWASAWRSWVRSGGSRCAAPGPPRARCRRSLPPPASLGLGAALPLLGGFFLERRVDGRSRRAHVRTRGPADLGVVAERTPRSESSSRPWRSPRRARPSMPPDNVVHTVAVVLAFGLAGILAALGARRGTRLGAAAGSLAGLLVIAAASGPWVTGGTRLVPGTAVQLLLALILMGAVIALGPPMQTAGRADDRESR